MNLKRLLKKKFDNELTWKFDNRETTKMKNLLHAFLNVAQKCTKTVQSLRILIIEFTPKQPW